MSRAKHQLRPERLIEAQEAALKAAIEVRRERDGAMPYPAD